MKLHYARRALLSATGAAWLFFAPVSRCQTQPRTEEVPLRQCDRLPVVTVRVDKTEMSFLVDSGATSILNSKSFSSGPAKDVAVTSWTGTTTTRAREISVAEFTLGEHTIRSLKLPAVDLSPIARACGGPIDGILGVDLLEQMGMSIDFQQRVARFAAPPAEPEEVSMISEMGDAMNGCSEAFNNADKKNLAECFDRDLVLNTPWGEYRGRENVLEYLNERFFSLKPTVQLYMKIHDQRAVGAVVWSSYDYTMDSRELHLAGRGMMLCHKLQDHWYILSIHDTLNPSEGERR